MFVCCEKIGHAVNRRYPTWNVSCSFDLTGSSSSASASLWTRFTRKCTTDIRCSCGSKPNTTIGWPGGYESVNIAQSEAYASCNRRGNEQQARGNHFPTGAKDEKSSFIGSYYLCYAVCECRHVVSNVLKVDRWSLPLLWHLSDIRAICNFWPELQILGGVRWPHPLTRPSRTTDVERLLAVKGGTTHLLLDKSL